MVEDGACEFGELVGSPMVPLSELADGLHEEKRIRKASRIVQFFIVDLLIMIELFNRMPNMYFGNCNL
jgi:hypothetical protein